MFDIFKSGKKKKEEPKNEINNIESAYKVLQEHENELEKFEKMVEIFPKAKSETLFIYKFKNYQNKEYPKGLLESENLEHLKYNIKAGKFENINIEEVLSGIDQVGYVPKKEDLEFMKQGKHLLLYRCELYEDLKKQIKISNNENDLLKLTDDVKRLIEENQVTNRYKAKICRKFGEKYNEYESKEKTIEYFELALNLDSKVGVKRMYDKLKNKIIH